jgi:hypothetical protein
MAATEQKPFADPIADKKRVASAIERAKAKDARLRLMKERNENYLAEHKDEPQAYEELPSDVGRSAAE